MNKAILMGRLTHDPELRQTNSGISVCNFQIAVDRRFKNARGEREADFIPIVCWRQQAEFVNRYFGKGSRIAIVGAIQVRNWEQDGQRRYMTEVIADEVYFADSKSSSGSADRSYDNRSAYGSNRYDSSSQQGGYSARNEERLEDDGFFSEPDDDTSLPFEL